MPGDSGDGAAAVHHGWGGGSGNGDVTNVLASSRARTEGTGRGCRLGCAASARRARDRGGVAVTGRTRGGKDDDRGRG